jgi:hypothetical protein
MPCELLYRNSFLFAIQPGVFLKSNSPSSGMASANRDLAQSDLNFNLGQLFLKRELREFRREFLNCDTCQLFFCSEGHNFEVETASRQMTSQEKSL